MIKQILEGFKIARKKREIQKRILETIVDSLYSGVEIKLNSQSFNKMYICENRLFAEIKITPEEALEILTEFSEKQAEISFELHHYILNQRGKDKELQGGQAHV